MSATTERVGSLVEPVLTRMGLELYDVDQPGPVLRLMVDREGGVDIDTLAEVTRAVSSLLDETEPVAGSYTLEVSSPGLERPLRRRAHFEGAIGEQVKVKLYPGTEGDRRCEGRLVSASDDAFTIESPQGPRTIALSDVAKAHTVFQWSSSEDSPERAPAGSARPDNNPANPVEPAKPEKTESTTESEDN